jgi:hypothetical protein
MNTTQRALTSGFVLLAIGLAQPAPAQQACADRALIMERLADGYGESRQSIGLGANNTLVEIYASLESGTWTITVTAPGGPTCLVASGSNFEVLAEGLVNTDPGA